jgi:hypothetical protein
MKEDQTVKLIVPDHKPRWIYGHELAHGVAYATAAHVVHGFDWLDEG